MLFLRNLVKSPSESIKFSANYIFDNTEARNSAKANLELHKSKYRAVLNDIESLNKENVDFKANFTRLIDYSRAKSESYKNIDEKTNDIKKCLKNVPESLSESAVPDLIKANLQSVEKFDFQNLRIPQSVVIESQGFTKLIKDQDPATVKLIKDAASASRLPNNNVEGTEELVAAFKTVLRSTDIVPLYDLACLASINETLSCLSMHGDIFLILGAKACVGTCFSLYNDGQFKYFLNAVITDFNFELLKKHAYKYCTSPGFYISIGFVAIAYSGQNVTWLKALSTEILKHGPSNISAIKESSQIVISVLKKDIKSCNSELVEHVSSTIQQVGFFFGKILGSFGAGFAKGTLDNSLELSEKVLKALKDAKK